MKTVLNLSIANPCAEDWNRFTTTTAGKLCGHCNKVVVDFTSMTDDEIIRFFQLRTSPTCGRFLQHQMRSYHKSSSQKIKPGFAPLKAGVLGVLLLLSKPAVVQAQTEKTKTEKTEKVVTKVGEGVVIENEHRISGVVLSLEDRSPIPGVNVVLKGTETGTVTSADGKFEFPKKLTNGDVLQFSCIGLMTEEFTIQKLAANERLEINMKMSFELLGEVAVNEVYSAGSSRISRWWGKLKDLF